MYFAAFPDKYEQIRASLDAAFGLPNDETDTAIPPASELPVDADGRVCVSAEDRLCTLAGPLVTDRLASGEAREITEEEFLVACRAAAAKSGEVL